MYRSLCGALHSFQAQIPVYFEMEKTNHVTSVVLGMANIKIAFLKYISVTHFAPASFVNRKIT
jgi:hypothetical protein